MSFVLTGKDTHNIDGRVLRDLATGEVSKLTFPNEQANVKTGKNDNAVFGHNSAGAQAEQTIRLLRGSQDDKYLNGRMAQQTDDPTTFVLLYGEFVKNLGDGAGNVAGDTYVNSGGVFSKRLEVLDQAEGDPEQGVVEYHIKWASSVRVIT